MAAKKFIIVIIILILGEVVFRIFYNPPELDSQFDWNAILWMNKYVYLNAAGYRDRDFSFSPPENTYRIFVVGNSYTYGWGINNLKDTYPKVIEQELTKKTGKKIEVINAGQPGFHLREDVLRFESEGKKFHPNLVVVGLNFNDANINNAYYYRADKILPTFITSLRLYDFLIGRFFQAWADKNNYDYYLSIYKNSHSPDWQTTAKLLLELKNEANKVNANVAILIFPHIDVHNPNAPYTFYPYNERYKEFAKKNNIIIIDPLSLYQHFGQKEDLLLNPIDEHPSVIMDHLAAEAFVNQFDSRLINTMQLHAIPLHTITLDKQNTALGNYSFIDAISSTNSLQWVYFDAASSNVENFPLYDTSSKQTFIYYDRISVQKDQPVEIVYNVYPDKPGKLVIPKTLYGYRVIGFKSFKGIAFANGVSSEIFPISIKQQQNNFIITYDPKPDMYVAQAEALIAVNKMEINPITHQVTNMTSVETQKRVIPEDTKSLVISSGDTIVSVPQIQKTNIIKSTLKNIVVTLHQITNWNIFSLTNYSGKVKPTAKNILQSPALQSSTSYAFVDGVLTQVRTDQSNQFTITLNFDHIIKKGQVVEFSYITNYPLQDSEKITVTTEEK